MKTKIKRILSAALVASMLLTLVPLNATEPFDVDTSGSMEDMSVYDAATDSDAMEESVIEEVDMSSVEDGVSAADILADVDVQDETDEVSDGLELNIFFYADEDKSIPLDRIDWTDNSFKKKFMVEIAYKNSNAVTVYQPGELKIEVLDIAYELNGGDYTYVPSIVTIGADEASSKNKTLEWSYSFKNIDGKRYIVFTNNNVIGEDKKSYNGFIQTTYELDASSLYGNMDVPVKASIPNLIESNEILLHHTTDNAAYRARAIGTSKIAGLDRLPDVDNYIWVIYNCVSDVENKDEATLRLGVNNTMCKIKVPDGSIVLKDLNVVEKDEDDYYCMASTPAASYGTNNTTQSVFYVGYPKEKYKDKQITQEVELWTKYADKMYSSVTADNTNEYVLVNSSSVTINANDFIYESSETDKLDKCLNNLWAYSPIDRFSSDRVRRNYSGGDMFYGIQVSYNGVKNDISVGNDILWIEEDDGARLEILKDDEYYYSTITIPNYKTLNGIPIQKDHYNMELFIRRNGNKEYESFEKFVYTGGKSYKFTKDDGIVGWYLKIYGLEESIDENIRTSVLLHKEDIGERGKLYSCEWLEVRNSSGTLMNPVDETMYDYDFRTQRHNAYDMNKLGIPVYDMETWGMYRQRQCAFLNYAHPFSPIAIGVSHQNTKNVPLNMQFESTIHIVGDYKKGIYYNDMMEVSEDYAGGIYYMTLPMGMELNGPITFVKNQESRRDENAQKIKTLSGKSFSSYDEYFEYMKQHTTFEYIENYRNSGRTFVKITIDYSDDHLDTMDMLNAAGGNIGFDIFDVPVKISYDSYMEYGNDYRTDWAFMPLERRDGTMAGGTNGNNIDNRSEEYLLYDDEGNAIHGYARISNVNLHIVNNISTTQNVSTYVKTDKSNYANGTVKATPGSEYQYKLNVTTGKTPMTDLVIYDSLESMMIDKDGNVVPTSAIRDKWQGEFLGVDTSYADTHGYNIKVWYSANEKASKLYIDGKQNTDWKEYSDSVDKPPCPPTWHHHK